MSIPVESFTSVGLGITPEGGWRFGFVPDLTAPGIAGVDFGELRDSLRLPDESPLHVLSDLDGTVRVADAETVDEETAEHIRRQLTSGSISSFTIITNSIKPSIGRFGRQIREDVRTFGVPQTMSKKPSHKFYEHVIKELGISGEPILAIGDKVTRDILGARRAGQGIVSLLVPPLGERDLLADRIFGRRFDNMARLIGNTLMRFG